MKRLRAWYRWWVGNPTRRLRAAARIEAHKRIQIALRARRDPSPIAKMFLPPREP